MQQFSKFNNSILDDGFGLAPRKIFKDERLNGYSKLIYLCISSYTNISFENAQAFPSINRIAEECGIGKTTAIKYLKQLEEYGYITVKKTVRDDGGFSNNIYLLNAVLGSPDEQGLVREMNKGLFAECTTPSSPDEQGLVRQVNPNNTNITIPINNTNKTNNNGQQADRRDSSKCSKEVKEIIGYWNERYNKQFKTTTQSTKSKVSARLREGFTVEDFKKVIDYKNKEWQGTEYAKYLVPDTLFGTKFEKYLTQATDNSANCTGIDRYMMSRGDDYGL